MIEGRTMWAQSTIVTYRRSDGRIGIWLRPRYAVAQRRAVKIWDESPMLSFPSQISRILYTIRPQKLKLLIRNHATAFRWYDCRWPWRYFKVIRLFRIKFLVNGAWYGKSYYRLRNRTLAFDWCHFWWPWRTSEGHFSLGCHFHVQYVRNYIRYIPMHIAYCLVYKCTINKHC